MTNASVTVDVTSASSDAIAPERLYVGLDLDFAPYRPPSSPTLGWRIPAGPPVDITAVAVAASAVGVPAGLSHVVFVPVAEADATEINPYILVVNGPQIPVPAEASAEGVGPALEGTYSIDTFPTPAEASADGVGPEPTIFIAVDAASATADGVGPTLYAGFVATAEAAAVNPKVEVDQPFAIAEAAAIPPTTTVDCVAAPNAADASADARNPRVQVIVVYTAGNTYTAAGIANDAYAIAVKPDQTRVYVTNYQNNNIAVINTANRATVTTITNSYDLTGRISGPVVSPDGSLLYVNATRAWKNDYRQGIYFYSENFDAILVVNTSTNTVSQRIPLTGLLDASVYRLFLSPDGTTLYGLAYNIESSGALLVIDLPSVVNFVPDGYYPAPATPIDIIPVGNQPTWMELSPDGDKAYVLNQLDKTVSIVNLATKTVTATVATGIGYLAHEQMAMSPDGSTLYVCEYGYDIKEIDTATATVTHTMNFGTDFNLGIPWVSGDYLYVPGNDNYIYVIDRATRTVTRSFLADGWAYYTLGVGKTKVYYPTYNSSKLTVIN